MRPGRSVCLSVTQMYPGKSAEPIEMTFGVWARVGPFNHVIDGGRDPPGEMGNFGGWKIWAYPRSVYSTTRCGLLSNYCDLWLNY